MTPGPVHGNAQKRRAMSLELGEKFVVQCQLVAADGTPISRIESQDHRLPTKFAEGKPLIRRDGEREIRRGCSARQDVGHGSPLALGVFQVAAITVTTFLPHARLEMARRQLLLQESKVASRVISAFRSLDTGQPAL